MPETQEERVERIRAEEEERRLAEEEGRAERERRDREAADEREAAAERRIAGRVEPYEAARPEPTTTADYDITNDPRNSPEASRVLRPPRSGPTPGQRAEWQQANPIERGATRTPRTAAEDALYQAYLARQAEDAGVATAPPVQPTPQPVPQPEPAPEPPPVAYPAPSPRPPQAQLDDERRQYTARAEEMAQARPQAEPDLGPVASDEMIAAMARGPAAEPAPVAAAPEQPSPAMPRGVSGPMSRDEMMASMAAPERSGASQPSAPPAAGKPPSPNSEPDYTGVDVQDVFRNIGHRIGNMFRGLGGQGPTEFESMGEAARARDEGRRTAKQEGGRAEREIRLRERSAEDLSAHRARTGETAERRLTEQDRRAEQDRAIRQQSADASTASAAALTRRRMGEEDRDEARHEPGSEASASDRSAVRGLLTLLPAGEAERFLGGADLESMNSETLRETMRRLNARLSARRSRVGAARGGSAGGRGSAGLREDYARYLHQRGQSETMEGARRIAEDNRSFGRWLDNAGNSARIESGQEESRDIRREQHIDRQITQVQQEWSELDYMHQINGQLDRALNGVTDLEVAAAMNLDRFTTEALSPAARRVRQLTSNMRDALARERTGAVINESEYASFNRITGAERIFDSIAALRDYIADTRRAREGRDDYRTLRLTPDARDELALRMEEQSSGERGDPERARARRSGRRGRRTRTEEDAGESGESGGDQVRVRHPRGDAQDMPRSYYDAHREEIEGDGYRIEEAPGG